MASGAGLCIHVYMVRGGRMRSQPPSPTLPHAGGGRRLGGWGLGRRMECWGSPPPGGEGLGVEGIGAGGWRCAPPPQPSPTRGEGGAFADGVGGADGVLGASPPLGREGVSIRRRPWPCSVAQRRLSAAFGFRGFGAHFLARRSNLSRMRPISASSGSNFPPYHSTIRPCSSCLGSAMASRKSA